MITTLFLSSHIGKKCVSIYKIRFNFILFCRNKMQNKLSILIVDKYLYLTNVTNATNEIHNGFLYDPIMLMPHVAEQKQNKILKSALNKFVGWFVPVPTPFLFGEISSPLRNSP